MNVFFFLLLCMSSMFGQNYLTKLTDVNELGVLAYEHYYKKEHEQAATYFERMQELHPDDVKVGLHLFECYFYQDKSQEALDVLKRMDDLIEVEPDPLERIRYELFLAQAYQKCGKHDLAQKCFKQIRYSRPIESDVYWLIKGKAHGALQSEDTYLCWRNIFDIIRKNKRDRGVAEILLRFFPIEDNLAHWYQQNSSKTYLLSYPRSGNTWLRYVIESLAQRPTLEKRSDGVILKHDCPLGYWLPLGTDFTKNPVWKVHDKKWMQEMGTFDPEQETLILIVRNYKEVITRHLGMPLSVKMLENADKRWDNVALYFKNLQLYDQWNTERRHLIYYEDLITNPKQVFADLLSFLGEQTEQLEAFMQAYDKHRQQGLNVYNKHAHSETDGNKELHHSNKIDAQEREAIDAFVAKAYPKLWDAYLSRYKEVGRSHSVNICAICKQNMQEQNKKAAEKQQ